MTENAPPKAGMTTSVPALQCRGLTRVFPAADGDVMAVNDFDLDVPSGSLTALLGPSGCGKTTVLRLVAGLEHPDAGTILLHGLPMARGREAVPAEKRNIGLVFQDYALFGHMSVADNVAYGLHRMDRAERRTRVNEALELVGLQTQAERHPGVLSGGQQQRVAIARALAPRPSMLLLDEPFSNLDAAMRSTVRAEVRQILLDAEITSLIVTHDQEEALSLADRVAVMSEGQLHQVDRPADLYRSPATTFVAKFVGDADIITVRPTGPSQVTGILGTIEIDGSAVEATQVMLRPEHLDVRLDDEG
ncbi:MAG: iron(III) transport system ATP-binding protein, partial [Glaciecola sp.]